MIEVHNLTKSFGGIAAIKNLTFKINKGEVVGFLGPNGAGKSTTMKIITGFMAPTSGVAKVGGVDVFENPIEVKKKIGYLPETPPVYTDMYVKDYLIYVAKLKGVKDSDIASSVQKAIEKTQLQSVQNRLIQNLSKGFKQRVGIAQAIVSDPEVLILDEPTVGLDPKQVAEIRDLIQELKGNHTIILSTHVLSEVQATCERIIIINKGEIVAQDTLANLSQLKSGTRKVILKVRKPSDSVFAAIKGISQVTDVHFDKANTYEISTSASDEVIEAIASAAIGKNAGLLEISSAKADLEDIFINLTYGNTTQPKGDAHV
jgi:ABC-2 type transport system ATP-binding protein